MFGKAVQANLLFELPEINRYNGQKAVYPIAAADPPSWEGRHYVYGCPAVDGFRFKS
jgi:hypothetical protein